MTVSAIRRLVIAGLVLAMSGCSTITGITNQHPAFIANSADCAVIGAAITTLLTVSPIGIIAGTVIAKGFCDAEGSVVGGPPATTTTTTTTVNSQSKST